MSGTPTPEQLSKAAASRRIADRRNSGNHSPGQSPSQDSPTVKTKKAKKDKCPCLRSSAGKDWVFACSECNQSWHSSCANLKGTNMLTQTQKPIIDRISKDWQCPWCWTCPYPKPGNHPSTMKEITLIKETLSASLYENLTETLTESFKAASTLVDLTPIQSELERLSSNIEDFQTKRASSNTTSVGIPPAVPVREVIDSPEPPYDSYKDNFLSSEEIDTIKDLLDTLKDTGDFVQEKGHSVKVYGQPYSYTGSRSGDVEPDPIPDELVQVIDKLCNELSLEMRPNSVLINHFPSSQESNRTESHLAMHSDDEATILAGSTIVTLSLGENRKVLFKPKHNNKDQTELLANHNSVYSMTRSSQCWFKHGIPPPEDDVEDRFSLTFRCLKTQFRRSILVIGDSNTREINFGSGTGKVGESFPGRRIKAAKVKDINPQDCIGYSNIFIVCGTNNLRCEYIKTESDIHHVVDELRHKISTIRQLCPSSKVFIVPVIPSRIPKMNVNIRLYNDLVEDLLDSCFPDVWFQGIYSFLDMHGQLSLRLCRSNDKIHLGAKGIAKLVTYIKISVFRREKYDIFNNSTREVGRKQKSAPEVGSSGPT